MAKTKGFNPYKITGDTTIIYYTDKFDNIIMEGYVDTEDLPRLKEMNLRWTAGWAKKTKSYYSKAIEYYYDKDGKRRGRTYCLNRVIMNAPKGTYVDHRGHNTLDDRKSNLRVTDNVKNSRNRKSKNSNNKSGYRNVSMRDDKWWIVQLQIEGKNTCLKKFPLDQLEEAGIYAQKMREQYYGEYAGFN